MGSSNSSLLEIGISKALGGDTSLFAFPSKPLYELEDAKPYNKSIPVKPAVVTYPKTAAQAAAIVKCAVRAGLKVQARSGGHSYANYCMFYDSPKHSSELRIGKVSGEWTAPLL
jgi:hypothetical protein